MKIAEHIYFYKVKGSDMVSPSNAVVIIGDEKQILIDPGTNIKNRLNDLIEDMKNDGVDIDKTTEIWLTHNHPDHSQMIHDLNKRFGGQRLVRCHPLAMSLLKKSNLKQNFIFQEAKKAGPYWKLLLTPPDRKKINPGTRSSTLDIIGEGISILWRKLKKIKVFDNRELVDVCPLTVEIIFLPGHAPDEIGFWIVRERVVILGDLVNISESNGNCKLILYNFHSDIDKALESLNLAKSLRPADILLLPHSAIVRGEQNIQNIFSQLINKINSYKIIAKDFIERNTELNGIQLVNKLAEEIPDKELLEIEKRFIAFAILKSLGRIKT